MNLVGSNLQFEVNSRLAYVKIAIDRNSDDDDDDGESIVST